MARHVAAWMSSTERCTVDPGVQLAACTWWPQGGVRIASDKTQHRICKGHVRELEPDSRHGVQREPVAVLSQAVTDHYQVLLNQGAGEPASPAGATLARLVHDSGQVLTSSCRMTSLHTRLRQSPEQITRTPVHS